MVFLARVAELADASDSKSDFARIVGSTPTPGKVFMEFFSAAQIVGYLACVVGIAAFLQKNDRKLKALCTVQGFVYVVHFWLLGNHAAATSSLVAGFRNAFSLKFHSKRIALFFMAVSVVLGLIFCTTPWGLLTVVGLCFSTWGMFTLTGIPMRVFILISTLCWLVNNIASQSIGGTILEGFIALANISTMFRMRKESLALASSK
jgi:hypothetical protein